MPIKRAEWPTRSHRYQTGCGWIYIHILRDPDDDNRIRSIFTNLGKAGGCAQAQTEAVSRLITRALDLGDDAGEIASSLRGMRCHRPADVVNDPVTSCADAIGRALQADIEMEEHADGSQPDS